ncbi:MAG: enoyl-ACP reductase [Pirellulales bacterium]|nr:enoyl-ACP reductase [Pirellulales bacterium]
MFFEGKSGLVFGIANNWSIAAAIASQLHQQGARMGFTHLPDSDPQRPKMFNRLRKVVGDWDPAFMLPCDVQNSAQVDAVFAEAEKAFGKIDFLLHAIAYAPLDELKVPTHQVSPKGFGTAMEISAYSFIDLANRAQAIMKPGGSILTMTYFGGERAVPGYNLMGVCKAALEGAVKYLANELGPQGIRVNALSAGYLKTLASTAVAESEQMKILYETFSPLRRGVEPSEVGKAGMFLLSDLASGITGENLHVDCGYHVVGAPPPETHANVLGK